MKKLGWLAIAATLGSGAVYFLDPKQGESRRTRVKDQATKFLNEKQETLTVMVNDFSKKSQGVAHEVQDKLESVALTTEEKLSSEGEIEQEMRWSPAACLVVGAAGLLLTLKGIFHRGMYGGVLSTIGVGLITKSFSDTESRMKSGDNAPLALEVRNSREEEEDSEEGQESPAKRNRARASVH